MPCFSTLFAFAFTALAALSSAAPVASGTSQVAPVVELADVANNVLQNVKISDIYVSALNVDRRQLGQAAELVDVEHTLDNLAQHVDVSGVDVEALNVHHVAKREEPQPIVAILLQAKAKLEATTSKLNDIVKGKAEAEVNLDDLNATLDEVHDTLLAALASVKMIVGQSATFILNHQGKMWTAAEVGSLLISVVVNVLYILTLVLHAVVSASHKAALAQVTVVADVMADLLQTVFVDLNTGIFAATRSQLTDALLKVWAALDLDSIVEVLKNGRL